jgi:hypothetical protein
LCVGMQVGQPIWPKPTARWTSCPAAELHPPIPVTAGGMTTVGSTALADALAASNKPLFVTGGNDWTQEGADQLTHWLEKHRIPAAAEWRTQEQLPSIPRPTLDPSGTAGPAHVWPARGNRPAGVRGHRTWRRHHRRPSLPAGLEKKNFLVTIDSSLRGRSGPVSYQIVAKPDVFIRDLTQSEFGMVGFNAAVISNAAAPFGGVKQSGLGREGGTEGIAEYTTTQYIGIADPYTA